MTKRPIYFCLLFVFLLICPLRLLAQMSHDAHAATGPVPRAILVLPVGFREGIGKLHEKVPTSSPEAQAFYDQGLANLHSYVWIEAIRSFHQALRSDPNLAMAYLALADAYIGLHDPATGRAAFNEAKKREKQMSDTEREWLAIRDAELAYAEDSGNPDTYVAYRKAVSSALKKNPNDPWLWIQRGLADEPSPFTHGQVGGVDALSFYRTALDIAPGNLAALHYMAHANENIGRTKEAVEETANYAKEAPAIPHAHHMHGHELMRLGRPEEAIAEFLKTKALEDAYYRTEKIPARYDWHHAHNLQLLAMSYQSLAR
jgi:tetratricopeptide (TPR) repeat protein